MSAPCPGVPICRLPAGTRFRFGSPFQPAAIHGRVEGPGVEGGVCVHLEPRKEQKKLADGTRGKGTLVEWSGRVLVEIEE